MNSLTERLESQPVISNQELDPALKRAGFVSVYRDGMTLSAHLLQYKASVAPMLDKKVAVIYTDQSGQREVREIRRQEQIKSYGIDASLKPFVKPETLEEDSWEWAHLQTTHQAYKVLGPLLREQIEKQHGREWLAVLGKWLE